LMFTEVRAGSRKAERVQLLPQDYGEADPRQRSN
jgi:hypothetical protein